MFGFIKKLFGHKPERPPTSQESQAQGPQQAQPSAAKAPQAILAPREDRVFPRKLPAREFDAFVNMMRDIVSGKIPSDKERSERAKELLRGLPTVKKFLYATYKMECEIYNAPAYVERIDPALSFISGVACPFRILDLGIISIHAPVLDYDRPNFWVNWSLDPHDYNSKFPHILFTFGRKEGEQFPDLRNCSCNNLFISEPKPEPPFYETIMETHKLNTNLLNVQIYRETEELERQERNSLVDLTKDIATQTPQQDQAAVMGQSQTQAQPKAQAKAEAAAGAGAEVNGTAPPSQGQGQSPSAQAAQAKAAPVFKNQNALAQPSPSQASQPSQATQAPQDHQDHSQQNQGLRGSMSGSFGGGMGCDFGNGFGEGRQESFGTEHGDSQLKPATKTTTGETKETEETFDPKNLDGADNQADKANQAAPDAPNQSPMPAPKPGLSPQQYALLVEKRELLRQAAARLEAVFDIKPKRNTPEAQEQSQPQKDLGAAPETAHLKKLLDVPERDFGPAIPYDLTGFGDDVNRSEVSGKYMSEMFGSNSLVRQPKKPPLESNLNLHAGISQTVASTGIETDSPASPAFTGLGAGKAPNLSQDNTASAPSSTGDHITCDHITGERKDFAFDAGPDAQVSPITRPAIKSLDVEDISEMARIDDDNASTALLPLIQIQELRLLVEKIFNITDRYSTLQAAGCTGYLLTSKLNAYLDPVARQNKRKWVECGSPKLAKESLAFEACHLAGILTMGADLGYLDTTEVLMIFQDIKDLLLENFSSWEEYGDAIVQQLNRCNKDPNAFKEVLFAIEQLKTNYYSPWNEMINPWPVFGL